MSCTRYQGIIKLFVARASVFGATWLMMLSIKCIITSITACPIQFAAILAIVFVWNFIIAVVLYIHVFYMEGAIVVAII